MNNQGIVPVCVGNDLCVVPYNKRNIEFLYIKSKIYNLVSKFLLNLSKDDLIILGVIILLFMNRHNDPKDDSYEVNEDTSKCNGLFNLERIKAILPFDKLSDSDILLILMVYLLL